MDDISEIPSCSSSQESADCWLLIAFTETFPFHFLNYHIYKPTSLLLLLIRQRTSELKLLPANDRGVHKLKASNWVAKVALMQSFLHPNTLEASPMCLNKLRSEIKHNRHVRSRNAGAPQCTNAPIGDLTCHAWWESIEAIKALWHCDLTEVSGELDSKIYCIDVPKNLPYRRSLCKWAVNSKCSLTSTTSGRV